MFNYAGEFVKPRCASADMRSRLTGTANVSFFPDRHGFGAGNLPP